MIPTLKKVVQPRQVLSEILFDPGDPSQIYRPVKRNTRIEMFIGLMFFVLSLTAIYFFKFK